MAVSNRDFTNRDQPPRLRSIGIEVHEDLANQHVWFIGRSWDIQPTINQTLLVIKRISPTGEKPEILGWVMMGCKPQKSLVYDRPVSRYATESMVKSNQLHDDQTQKTFTSNLQSTCEAPNIFSPSTFTHQYHRCPRFASSQELQDFAREVTGQDVPLQAQNLLARCCAVLERRRDETREDMSGFAIVFLDLADQITGEQNFKFFPL